MNKYNDKGQRHGYWEYYYDNGSLAYQVKFLNGQLSGYLEWLYPDGSLRAKVFHL
jgi:antitoxin component YwqK of YwqJK toxin-antitoxin module